jgi:hypothetical protein
LVSAIFFGGGEGRKRSSQAELRGLRNTLYKRTILRRMKLHGSKIVLIGLIFDFDMA